MILNSNINNLYKQFKYITFNILNNKSKLNLNNNELNNKHEYEK